MGRRATLIRYADDFIIIFATKQDAEKVMEVLPERFSKYGLRLHPDKARLVEFRPGKGGGGGRRAFDFLGFIHFWKLSRKGKQVVTRKTASSRFQRVLKRIKVWCRSNRHLPVMIQYRKLTQALRGHYAYFGITGNLRMLNRLRYEVERIWHKWLLQRSQKQRLNWERFHNFLKHYSLPPARVVHSVYRGVAKPLF